MFYKRRLDELNKIIDNFNSYYNKTGYEYLAVLEAPKKNYLPRRYLGDYCFEYHTNYLLMINGIIINNGEEIKIEFDYTFGDFNSSKSAVICGNIILDETDATYEITISQKGVNVKKGISFKSIKRIETTRNNRIVYDSSTYSCLNINMEKYYYIMVYKDKIPYDIIYPGDFVFLGLSTPRISNNTMDLNTIVQFPMKRIYNYNYADALKKIIYRDIYGTSMTIRNYTIATITYENRGDPYSSLTYESDSIHGKYVRQLKVLRRGVFWNDMLKIALGQAYSVSRQQCNTDYDVDMVADISSLLNIPEYLKYEGNVIYVISANKHYLYKGGVWSEMIETDDSIKLDTDKPEIKHQYTYDDPVLQKEASALTDELRSNIILDNIIPESVRRSSKQKYNYYKI